MSDKEEKDYKESNRKRMLLALLLLMGEYPEKTVQDYDFIAEKYPKLLDKAVKIYEKNHLEKIFESGTTLKSDGSETTTTTTTVPRATEQKIFETAAKIGWDNGKGAGYFKILGTKDDKTCPGCMKWIGKTISMTGNDPRYPSYDQMIHDHVFHKGCRCSLHEVKVQKPNIEKLALNEDPKMKDTMLYTGFVENFNNIDPVPDGLKDICRPQTYDFGSTLVQISPLGTYLGWNGKTSVEEIVDEEACLNIIRDLNENPREILVDRDHGSCKAPEERDTTALAWASNFQYINNLGNLSGLYCTMKWTSEGRKLVEDRTYRFLSPVWSLDDNGRPLKMISIGLTNRPAIKSKPIINTLPENTEEIEMNKEELVKIIKETVTEVMNTCGTAPDIAQKTASAGGTGASKSVAENEDPEKEKPVKVEDPVKTQEDLKTDPEKVKKEDPPADYHESEKDKKPVKNEDPVEKTAEDKEIKDSDVVKTPPKTDIPKKKEVIKEEILNTSPEHDIGTTNKNFKVEALKLKGQAFIDYVRTHRDEVMNCWSSD